MRNEAESGRCRPKGGSDKRRQDNNRMPFYPKLAEPFIVNRLTKKGVRIPPNAQPLNPTFILMTKTKGNLVVKIEVLDRFCTAFMGYFFLFPAPESN